MYGNKLLNRFALNSPQTYQLGQFIYARKEFFEDLENQSPFWPKKSPKKSILFVIKQL